MVPGVLTDCVLISGEIVWIKEQSDLLEKRHGQVHSIWRPEGEGEALHHDGARSSRYLAHSFRHATKQPFHEDVREVTCRTLKNNGDVLLCFAAVYCFQNIQDVVLKLEKGKLSYHLVEVLAGTSGCLNDRGQDQTEDGHETRYCCGRWKASTPRRPAPILAPTCRSYTRSG